MKGMTITRRDLLQGAAGLASAAALGWNPATAAEAIEITVVHSIEPGTLTAPLGGGTTVAEHSAKLFDTLIFTGVDGQEPRLARSWSSSKDGTIFEFELVPGVKWHDGKAFTSADVAFTATEIWKPMSGNVAYSRIDSVETPDAHKVIFHMAEAVSPDFMMNSLGTHFGIVMPRHIYEGTDMRQSPANRAPVGTGPFRFKEWKSGQYLIYERNPDYYRDSLPVADRLIYRFEKSEANVVAVLESGQGDLAVRNSVPLRDVERLRGVNGLRVTDAGADGAAVHLHMELNMRREATAKLEVRRAIAHAIDVKALIDMVFLGYGKPLATPLPNGSPFLNTDVPVYEFDPEKAEAMLDEAGYPRNGDGVRMTLDFVVASWYPTTRQAGDVVRQQLEDVGIKLNLVTPDFAGTVAKIYKDYDFDLALSNSLHFTDPGLASFYWYWSKAIQPGVPFRNATGYTNPKMDEAIETALSTTDTELRRKMIDGVQLISAQDLPLIPLVEMTQFTVYNASLTNIADNPRWSITSWEKVGKSA